MSRFRTIGWALARCALDRLWIVNVEDSMARPFADFDKNFGRVPELALRRYILEISAHSCAIRLLKLKKFIGFIIPKDLSAPRKVDPLKNVVLPT